MNPIKETLINWRPVIPAQAGIHRASDVSHGFLPSLRACRFARILRARDINTSLCVTCAHAPYRDVPVSRETGCRERPKFARPYAASRERQATIQTFLKRFLVFGCAAAAAIAGGNLQAQTTTFPQRPPDPQINQPYPSQQYPNAQLPATPSYSSPSYPTQPAYPTQPSSYLPQPYELPASSAPTPPFTPTTPLSAQAGCNAELSTDRSTIALIDRVSRQELRHVALGQDRVQKLYTAPDTTWSVALAKVRGAERFYFIAIDLAQCEAQDAVVVGAKAEEATFSGAEVVLKVGGNEQRFALRNK